MQELNVERVSKNGVLSGGKWYNLNKYANPIPSLNGISAGMVVNVELNKGGYITTISPTGGTHSVVSSASSGGGSFSGPNKERVRVEIARGTAVKAVLGSPLLYALYKNDTDKSKTTEELTVLIKQFTGFILSGVFDEKESPLSKEEVQEEVAGVVDGAEKTQTLEEVPF